MIHQLTNKREVELRFPSSVLETALPQNELFALIVQNITAELRFTFPNIITKWGSSLYKPCSSQLSHSWALTHNLMPNTESFTVWFVIQPKNTKVKCWITCWNTLHPLYFIFISKQWRSGLLSNCHKTFSILVSPKAFQVMCPKFRKRACPFLCRADSCNEDVKFHWSRGRNAPCCFLSRRLLRGESPLGSALHSGDEWFIFRCGQWKIPNWCLFT